MMNNFSGCCICEISDATDVDPLVYCDDCNLAVHKLCYGIKDIPDGDWFCNIVSKIKFLIGIFYTIIILDLHLRTSFSKHSLKID